MPLFSFAAAEIIVSLSGPDVLAESRRWGLFVCVVGLMNLALAWVDARVWATVGERLTYRIRVDLYAAYWKHVSKNG